MVRFKTGKTETPVGNDFSLALYFIKDAAISFFSESGTFLENKENVTASSFRYHKCLLKVKKPALATPVRISRAFSGIPKASDHLQKHLQHFGHSTKP
ncbi:hypothetical protein AVEN_201072-1 [Araneus ventricosus]|uniref:Uncharacterized protein n=1 Tax=Araneus ventricosus TaxID=182803 RepID=A0A4Y2AES9_ARAVE|nr:hypothetical protein AVEN_43473-1 [Araneus ventricosus]GBL77829.1 hypothetical protein AVEN_201072-1 [Araneus ventricosus]